jgi:hydrogenase maturation factor HypF (carbamoyltransferase family)
MAGYESDITRFLRDLKQQKPEIARVQREGRAIFWDKTLDADQLKRWKESQSPMRSYVFFDQPRPSKAGVGD